MLRIGEAAELAGVSTRTIRHYHQIGLLPEPIRMPNGYRGYGPKDVVLLLRVRRMVESGLRLDEIANVLATADRAQAPRDILLELDTHLAEQERRIRKRRKRIAELLAKNDESTYSAELADLLTNLERTETAQPSPDVAPRMFNALANELSPPQGTTPTAIPDQTLASQLAELSQSFHQLAGRPPTDPAIAALAHRAAQLAPTLMAQPPEHTTPPAPHPTAPKPLDPAQARCWQLLLNYLHEQT